MWWQLLFLLLPVASACGWYFGYKHKSVSSTAASAENHNIPGDYFLGLNYLINEQPDKAVDAFIKVLEVNSDTVEMHLAIGNLFRRKGEVDRATKIHQNLIARPQLTKKQRSNALTELAQDYLRAGFLDRAERLLLELVELENRNIINYKFLLNIYEKQKNWHQAITTAQKLLDFSDEKTWTPIAYYYCALAEESMTQGLIEQTEIHLKKALALDKNCARASIMLGELAANTDHYKTAIYFCKQVKKQDTDFLSEVAPLLVHCYEKLGRTEEAINFLHCSLQETYSAPLALFIAKHINQYHNTKAAIEFIANQNRHGTSLRILEYLLDLCVKDIKDIKTANGSNEVDNNDNDQRIIKNNLNLAQQLLDRLLNNKPYYRCVNCGLGTRRLYWQCPGCRCWAKIKPIKKFEIG